MSTRSPSPYFEHADIIGKCWFTHPDRIAEDTTTLQYMKDRLYQLLQTDDGLVGPPPLFLYPPEPDGHHHRVVALNVAALRTGAELTIVGFFGQKRAGADTAILDELDVELIGEFLQYPNLLSYSSLELEHGSWGNLVVMSNPEGIAHWAGSTRHAYAAQHIAPKCYQVIRLHNGFLPAGLAPGGALSITQTKFYDFSGDMVRRAIRAALY